VFFVAGLFGFSFWFSPYYRGWLCNKKILVAFTMYFEIMFKYVVYVLFWCEGGFKMGRIRLYVRTRKQGSYIASVPLKQLVKLSKYRKRRWDFKDGWLILEAF